MAEQKKPARKPAMPRAAVPAMAQAAAAPPAKASAAVIEAVIHANEKTIETLAETAEQVEATVSSAAASAPAVVDTNAAAAVRTAETFSTDTLSQGTETMATTAETVTATTQAAADKFAGAFADVQGRAKGAMEKSGRFYEEMGDFAKGNVEALIASSRVAASGLESLGQDAAAYGKKSLEQATATFRSVSQVKSPTEFFQLQNDYARASFDAMVAESSRVSEKMVKLAGDVFQPLSSRMALAAEKVKSASL